MKNPITVILAEDIVDFRESIRTALLDPDIKIKVIGEAGNGLELLELLKTNTPDIILLDLKMPHMNGSETMTILAERYPNIKVIILSGHDQQVLMDDFFLRGAKGYVPKSELSELVAAIVKVIKGGEYRFHKEGNQNEFTPRHKQVIRLGAQGKSQIEIAKELKLSKVAIWKNEKAIMGFLGAKSREEMLQRITQLGLNFLGNFGLGPNKKT